MDRATTGAAVTTAPRRGSSIGKVATSATPSSSGLSASPERVGRGCRNGSDCAPPLTSRDSRYDRSCQARYQPCRSVGTPLVAQRPQDRIRQVAAREPVLEALDPHPGVGPERGTQPAHVSPLGSPDG